MWQTQALELAKKLEQFELVKKCVTDDTPEKTRGDIFIRTCHYHDATVKIGHNSHSAIFVSVKTSAFWASK